MATTLAIDVMGGDHSPGIAIEGISIAQKQYPDIKFQLYGNEALIKPFLSQFPFNKDNIEIIHTTEFIPGDMKPSTAVRQSKFSSMRLAIEAVAAGKADAVVSAGNTGAYMALSKLILKTLKGIDRPAIAATLPTVKGYCVVLDLGANTECSVDNLMQFSLMGEIFAREVLGKKKPSVGLLNVGVEDLKGNTTIKTTYSLLKNSDWVENFYGSIEGNDILEGTVDVVVTDGFTGNVALKTAEGTFCTVKDFFVNQFKRNWFTRLTYLLVKPAFMAFKSKFDPRIYNGAPFLGLDGISVKSHGNADGLGFSYAIHVAADMVLHDINKLIQDGLVKRYDALDNAESSGNQSQ